MHLEKVTSPHQPLSDVPRESASAIDAAAFAWAARLDQGALSSTEQAEFDLWIAGDVRRLGAFARATAADAYLERAAALGRDFQPASGRPGARWSRRQVLWGGGTVAAGLAAAAVGLSVWDRRGRIATARGDVLRVVLAEHSAVTLNTDTVLYAQFSEGVRAVRLDRGEALFDVAKDPERPFIVFAGYAEVEAIGTSFTVRRHEDGRIAVVVREGVVEVRRAGEAPLRLHAGSALRPLIDQGVVTERLSEEEIGRTVEWREGRLDLTGMTLQDAAREYGRYSDVKIEVASASIGALQVTGVYSTTDPKGFAQAAALSLGLRVEETAAGVRIVE